jgi:hypothetical protein
MSDALPTTSNGKIARLPARLRERVNRRLHDGETAPQILSWLNALPEVLKVCETHFAGELVSPQNLSAWRNGGFQLWLRQRDEIESTKALAKYAAELADAAGLDMGAAAKAVAAGKVMARLQTLNDESDLGDVLALTKAAKDLHGGDIDQVKVKQSWRLLETRERQVSLAEKNYALRFTDDLLKYVNDARVREIAASKESKTVKMDQLVQLIFGGKPEEAASRE